MFSTIETDERTATTVGTLDSELDTVSVAVSTLVAHRDGVSACDLPPVYDSVEPDALDTLLTHSATANVRVSFEYHGYDVVVQRESVALTPLQ